MVRLDAETALIQTLDFFPPVVDDPVWFGRIAAANALSDVYAMGGRPLTAMNIVGFPAELPPSLLGQILRGGAEKVIEAGAVTVGGHSVRDSEIKYGLSVSGLVHPDRMLTNAGARAGNVLVLTKPLGMGSIGNAIKVRKLDADAAERASEQMATLNRDAAEAALAAGATGATDITGFGLLGHGRGMAEASGVTLEFLADALPSFPGSLELIGQGFVSGGAARTRVYLGDQVEIDAAVDEHVQILAFDAETSGGLLIAVPEAGLDGLLADLRRRGTPCASVVGRIVPRSGPARVRLGPGA